MSNVPDGQITLAAYLETRKKIELGGCGKCYERFMRRMEQDE